MTIEEAVKNTDAKFASHLRTARRQQKGVLGVQADEGRDIAANAVLDKLPMSRISALGQKRT